MFIKKKAIIIIIVVTSLAMVGIILTQVFWINTALKIKEEQFDNKIRIAVKGVVNQLLENKNDTVFQEKLRMLSCRKSRLDIYDYIDPVLLDSLVNAELKCMRLEGYYYYTIYNKANNRMAFGRYEGFEKELIDSPYQFSVSSIYRPGDYYLSVYFPDKAVILIKMIGYWLLWSAVFLLVLIISFFYVVSNLLQQKKISEIKNDFINNMTHEFKTPIATTCLAAEMIQRDEVIADPQRIKKYADIIHDENKRLQNQIEQLLNVAALDQEEPSFKMKKLNVHQLLDSVTDSFELLIKKSNASVLLHLDAANPNVIGDKFHLMSVFYNLLDNAIKYSPNSPEIEISTHNHGNQLVVSFKDNGIGVSHEHQKDIFKNLFRVPTGNIHEVRGFGLGLYYAKTVVEYHKGRIQIKSELGKGSTFLIYLNSNH